MKKGEYESLTNYSMMDSGEKMCISSELVQPISNVDGKYCPYTSEQITISV